MTVLDRIDQIWASLVDFHQRRPVLFVGVLVLVAFLLRLAATPFGAPVNLDVFAYMLKAVEINRGDWVPVRSHAIGWSILLAPVLALGRNADSMTVMNLTRATADLAGALLIIPFAILVRETLDRRAQVLALLLCPFALLFVRMSVRGFSEPALTGVLVGGVAAALTLRRSHRRHAAWIVAGLFGGCGFWLHSTGLLNIAIVAAVVLTATGRPWRWGPAAATVGLALMVSAPAGVQRARAFDGPLDFSFNTRFFAASNLEVWTGHAQTPSLGEYVSTRSTSEILDRLFVEGLWAELRTFSLDVLHGVLVPLVLYGCWLARRDGNLRPHVLALALFLLAWVPVYELYGNGRHLSTALPFALALSAAAVSAGTRTIKHGGACMLVLALAFAIGESTAAAVQRQRSLNDFTLAGMEWGRWTAEHVRGRLAISEGHEHVMMFLPDAKVAGADIFTMYAPASGLSLMRPGEFRSLDEALAWMKAQQFTHVVVDPGDNATPYLRPLATGALPPYLVEVYASPPDSRWPVRILQFNWDK